MQADAIKKLMRGAMWLTIASLVTKILSVVYRVPFQNMVGDVGFYIFQQVYPFYGIAMMLSLGGFPVVISRMLAEVDEKDIQKQQIILQTLYRIIKIISWIIFAILFCGAEVIAYLMGDLHLSLLLRVISFVFLITPHLSFYRGYFQGQGVMGPTAISQTIEQFTRVSIILFGAAYIYAKKSSNLYMAGAIGMSGAFFGGVIAFFILFFLYKKNLQRKSFTTWKIFASKQEKKRISLAFLKQSATICIVSSMLILFQFADSFQVYRLMTESGIREVSAQTLKGIYDRAQPILQLGLVLSTALALALLPMITSARAAGENQQLKRSLLLATKLTLILASAETVGLIVIMRALNQMLFQTSEGTLVLQVFMPAVFLSSLIVMISSILQGFGQLNAPALAVITGFLIKLICNQFLVPRYATIGAALSTCIGLTIVLIICYIALKRNINTPFIQLDTLLYLVLSLIVMAIFPYLFEKFSPLTSRIGSSIQALISTILGGSAFLFMTFRCQLFDSRDFVFLPLGSKLFALRQIIMKNKNRK